MYHNVLKLNLQVHFVEGDFAEFLYIVYYSMGADV